MCPQSLASPTPHERLYSDPRHFYNFAPFEVCIRLGFNSDPVVGARVWGRRYPETIGGRLESTMHLSLVRDVWVYTVREPQTPKETTTNS